MDYPLFLLNLLMKAYKASRIEDYLKIRILLAGGNWQINNKAVNIQKLFLIGMNLILKCTKILHI